MTINTENIFGKDGFVWFIGVIENRKDDPDRLGRVRVRIMGYHSDDLEVLPQEELPWAIVMQPTTSAGVSGIGSSPTNLLEGSWVVGFFLDGREKQQPIIIGTIGGFTQKVPFCAQEATYEGFDYENVLRTPEGAAVVDGEGLPITTLPDGEVPPAETPGGGIATPPTEGTGATGPDSGTASAAVRAALPPLSRGQIQSVMDALGTRESGNNYGADNGRGYVGKYQFGSAALEQRGLIRRGATAEQGPRAIYNDENWTNPAAPSLRSFLNNPGLQEQVMYDNMATNYRTLTGNGTITTSDSPERVGGLLSAAHLGGPGGARALARGSERTDALGTSTRNYYDLGYTAVALTGQTGGMMAAVNASRRGIPTDLAGAAAAGAAMAIPVSRIPSTGAGARTPPAILSYAPGETTDWVAENELLLRPTEAFQDPNKKFPKCDYIDKPDTNKLATGDVVGEDTPYERKLDAAEEHQNILVAGGSFTWDEPPPAYCAEYPYNQVFESEAGHVVEFDNTPGYERIHVYHKKGTYIEIDSEGSFTKKTAGSDYEIVEKNKYLRVMGDYNVTVENGARVLVKGDAHIQVGGDALVEAGQNLDLRSRNIYIRADNSVNIEASDFNVSTNQIKFESSKFDSTSGKTVIGGGPVLINNATPTPPTISGGAEPEGGKSIDDPARLICELEPPIYEEQVQEEFMVEGETAEFEYTFIPATPERLENVYTAEYIEFIQTAAASRAAALGLTVPADDGNIVDTFVDPGNTIRTIATGCVDLNSITTFPPGLALSRYFTLGSLTPDIRGLVGNSGVTPNAGSCNLRNLAVNTLDDIIERFPDMNVLTGTFSYALPSFTAARNAGQGVLMQFTDTPYSDYINIAAWIRDNVPYSQLNLNYRNDPSAGLISTIGVALGSTTNTPKVATVVDGNLLARYLFPIL